MVRRIGRFCEVMFEDERWARDDVSRERLMRRRCGGEVVENKEMIRVSLRSQFPSKKNFARGHPQFDIGEGSHPSQTKVVWDEGRRTWMDDWWSCWWWIRSTSWW